ncbi:MAG: hypothetical protein J6Y72_06110 [Bacteroidales bacterium]|nr:hypothetical protein [Bacteroidales bacterium]
MKLYIYTSLILLLAACSNVAHHEQWLAIDFNGTIKQEIYLQTTDNVCIDTAHADNYIYRFDIADLPYGVYNVVTPDSAYIPIVKDNDDNITICARRNHLREATTDNSSVVNLWKINVMSSKYNAAIDSILTHNRPTAANRKAVAAQINAVVNQWKPIVAEMVTENSNSLCVLPLLKFGESSTPLFNLIDDYNMYKYVVDNADEKLSNNEEITKLRNILTDNADIVSFVHTYNIGHTLPDVSLRTNDASVVKVRDLAKPSIIICNADSSSNAANIWNYISAKRFLGYVVLADVPTTISGNATYNIIRGELTGTNAVTLRKLQPIIIAADANGEITHIVPYATYEDDALYW